MSHLLGPSSGWDKLPGTPVTLYLDPRIPFTFDQVVEKWHRICGRPLFTQVLSASADAVVEVRPNPDPTTNLAAGYSYVLLAPSSAAANYTHATVRIAPEAMALPIIWHELGHVLGFADHGSKAAESDGPRYTAICDDRADPRYSPYDGVMSYCNSSIFNRADADMLEAAGLRIPGSPIPWDEENAPPPVTTNPFAGFFAFLAALFKAFFQPRTITSVRALNASTRCGGAVRL